MQTYGTVDDSEQHKAIHDLLVEANRLWDDRQAFKEVLELARRAEAMIRNTSTLTSELNRNLVESLTLRAECSWLDANFADGLAAVTEAVRICEEQGFEDYLTRPLLLWGTLLSDVDEDAQALKFLLRAEGLAERYQQKREQVDIAETLGAMFAMKGNLSDSETYFKRALVLAEDLGETRLIAAVLQDIAVLNRQKGALEDALSYAERAQILFEKINRAAGLATVHLNLGNIFQKLGRYEEALVHYRASLHNAFLSGRARQEIAPLGAIAELYLKQGNEEEALAKAQEMLTKATDLQIPFHQKRAHEILARIYEGSGDNHSALSHYKAIANLQAIVAKEQFNNHFEKLTILHQNELAKTEQALAVEVQRRQIFSDFIRDAAHDLRTPITVMKTNLYLYEKQKDAEKQARAVASIKARLSDLEAVLEAMFEMARLDSVSRLELKPVKINQLLQVVAQRIMPMLNEKAQNLVLDLSSEWPVVSGNEEQIVNCLMILMENAVRYTAVSGRISLRSILQADTVQVIVEDSGIGISSKDLPHIFERFFRGDAARTISGTGLGLAIAQRIAELHRSKIEVTSQEGVGSVFYFGLKRTTPQPD